MLPFADYNISSSDMETTAKKTSRKKKKKIRSAAAEAAGEDELAAVKAAAWAWYNRNEGKPVTEFDLNRDRKTCKPSRYKIEATKNTILAENKILAEHRVTRSTEQHSGRMNRDEKRDSCLLDSYEIENLCKRLDLDRFSDTCPNSPINGFLDRCSVSKKKKSFWCKQGWKGILLRPMAVCGRGDDVEVTAFRNRWTRLKGLAGSHRR